MNYLFIVHSTSYINKYILFNFQIFQDLRLSLNKKRLINKAGNLKSRLLIKKMKNVYTRYVL